MVGADSTLAAKSQSILFWGTKLSPTDSPYKKTLPFLLTIQSAAILPSEEATPITLNAIINENASFPLCTLRPNSSHQTSLGYILNPGTTIDFRVEGKGDIYLSGYFHIEPDEDEDEDDEMIEEKEGEQDNKLEALREMFSQADELGLDDDENDDDEDEEEKEEKPTPPKKEKPKSQEKPKKQEKTKEKPKSPQDKNKDKNNKPDQNKKNQGKNQNQNKSNPGKNQESQQKGKKRKGSSPDSSPTQKNTTKKQKNKG